MTSIHIEQGPEGPLLRIEPERASEVRSALFQACIPFQEMPLREGVIEFHVEDGTPRSTLLRALEAVP